MPKLKPDTQRARREHILDAAERCFARAGFHATSMHDICREAAVSPGALYVYFSSKEALISGLAERDRLAFQQRFIDLTTAPDFFAALGSIGRSYFIDDPRDRCLMCVEVGLESTRNQQVGEVHRSVDEHVRSSFEDLFARMTAEGRIAPALDAKTLADIIMVLADGMFWRRGVHASFDADAALSAIVTIIRQLLKPVASLQPPSGGGVTPETKANP